MKRGVEGSWVPLLWVALGLIIGFLVGGAVVIWRILS